MSTGSLEIAVSAHAQYKFGQTTLMNVNRLRIIPCGIVEFVGWFIMGLIIEVKNTRCVIW